METTTPTDGYDRIKEVKAFDDSKLGCKGLLDSGAITIPRFFHHPFAALRRPSPPSHAIPTVDLSHVRHHRRPEILRQIRDAAHTWGFFQVINHGVPPFAIKDLISSVRSFNELPPELRSQHYGREPSRGFSYSSNVDLYRSKAATWRDTIQVRLGPDPSDPEAVPEVCRGAVAAWGEHVRDVGEVLLEVLSEGLGLEKGRLRDLTCLEARQMVGHYYPHCPQANLTLGLGAHSDPGVMTVLLQDQIGGLQVMHGGEWVEVEPLHGALVVNIGDLLQIMSNDEYKSVEHRVAANTSIEPRISIAVFFSPSRRGETDYYGPLPELLSNEKPAHYRNFTLPEFMRQFFSRELGCLPSHFKL